MLLSYAAHLLGDSPLADRLARLRRAGFDGVDLPASALTDPTTPQLVADSGLAVGAVYSQVRDPGLLSARNAERATALDQVVERAEAGAAVGAAVLIVVPVFGAARLRQHADVADLDSAQTAVLLAGLDELAERVADLPITIALEPLNQAETHFLTDPTRAATLCRSVGSPRIATMVDTYHCHREGQDIAAAIADARDQLALIHLSDSNRGLPGEAEIDFGSVLAAVRTHDYAGWLGLECPDRGDEAGGDAAIRRSVEHLRALWDDLAPQSTPSIADNSTTANERATT